ncbi:rhomboid family intramembrane serine protease [Sphingosinicella rhizophila]|uniref:Rhomboid family intramembrane serine protease n=1 Tax=Sphingosinicella rhizophila TaxID=3050082 RepID=A0ABU3Q2J5_9SPHN|nr:rhomboid family intramembrane serine protease [Sphingosinicella sp. GR2756]MDT9597622.1 rhomboid family intramembrane serine protease [Sphingosinicella sp. GR2756]
MTLAIAIVTAAAWLIASALGLQDLAVIWGGFIPARVGGVVGDEMLAPVFLTPLTATVVHAGIIHLGFNLLIHLFCGRATETIIGGRGLLILYIVGAYAAAAAQFFANPEDMRPMVGASGAISAVLGTYAILFGRNRVNVANLALARWLNALWLAAAWIGLQILVGFTFETAGAPLAIAAHIGGFLAGLVLAKPLLLLRYRGA